MLLYRSEAQPRADMVEMLVIESSMGMLYNTKPTPTVIFSDSLSLSRRSNQSSILKQQTVTELYSSSTGIVVQV